MPDYPDYPFTSQFTEINGHRMHYIDEGPHDGEVIVFVHGNPTWSFYFRHLINRLKHRYRCVAMDHIGMGLSAKPDDTAYSYKLEQRIYDLGALIEHLQLPQELSLLVHDWGGMIGLGWGTLNPSRVKRIMLANTAAFALPTSKPLPWQLIASRSPMGGIMVRGLNGFCKYAVKHCAKRHPLSAEVSEALLAPYNNWDNRRAVHRFVQDIPLKPSHPSWHMVDQTSRLVDNFGHIPMLIMWGLQDFVFDQHFLAEWERRFPDAEYHRFADGGHYIFEDYGQECADLMVDFLHKHAIAAPAVAHC